jgi:hypothetical protein
MYKIVNYTEINSQWCFETEPIQKSKCSRLSRGTVSGKSSQIPGRLVMTSTFSMRNYFCCKRPTINRTTEQNNRTTFMVVIEFSHFSCCSCSCFLLFMLSSPVGGYVSVWYVSSFSASFAASLAASFPGIPTWLGTHIFDICGCFVDQFLGSFSVGDCAISVLSESVTITRFWL